MEISFCIAEGKPGYSISVHEERRPHIAGLVPEDEASGIYGVVRIGLPHDYNGGGEEEDHDSRFLEAPILRFKFATRFASASRMDTGVCMESSGLVMGAMTQSLSRHTG
jgi:hypothetical protein